MAEIYLVLIMKFSIQALSLLFIVLFLVFLVFTFLDKNLGQKHDEGSRKSNEEEACRKCEVLRSQHFQTILGVETRCSFQSSVQFLVVLSQNSRLKYKIIISCLALYILFSPDWFTGVRYISGHQKGSYR